MSYQTTEQIIEIDPLSLLTSVSFFFSAWFYCFSPPFHIANLATETVLTNTILMVLLKAKPRHLRAQHDVELKLEA
tara:strand:- start:300 stop:527 length:228 start_codon:yes stop_codon:yes gene_type:complete